MAFKLKTKNHLYDRGLDKNSNVFRKAFKDHVDGHTTTTTSGEWSDWKQDPNNPERYTRNRTNTTVDKIKGKGGGGLSYEESYKNADKSTYPTLDSWKKYVDDYNKGSSNTSSNVETQEKFVTPKVPTIPTLPIKPIEMDPPDMTPITPGKIRFPRKPQKPSLIDRIRDIDLIPGDKYSRRGWRIRTSNKIKRGLRRINPFKPRNTGPCWYN
tara:strand:- start:971 stop:1606 length:636 start_codon:yes stop_codon:yes gene_type:complete